MQRTDAGPTTSTNLLQASAAIEGARESQPMERVCGQSGQSRRKLANLSDMRCFFRRNKTPIYFIGPTVFNLLGLDEWVANVRFIVYTDCLDGRNPNVFAPPETAHEPFGSIEDVNNHLLAHAAVADHIREHGPGKALFLMFDETTEALAGDLGLEVCLPPAHLRHYLDNKLVTTRLAEAAGVGCVPNVIAPVDSWERLRQVTRGLGPDLVVQKAYGDSGKTTYMISNQADWCRHAGQIVGAGEVKIMKRIRARSTAIEACVTRHGTLVAPMMTEMIGFDELTPYKGGWCGNEIFPDPLNADLMDQARTATAVMGHALREQGYRGYFELDFLVDADTGMLYLGEMNPRLTGASPMTNHAPFAQADIPLILFHLLEWMDVDYTINLDEVYRRWRLPENIDPWSQLVFKHTANETNVLSAAPPSGIWRMDGNGEVRFLCHDISRHRVENESTALFLRIANAGDYCTKGTDLGIVMTRGRLMTEDFRLTERARAWFRGFRSRFTAAAPNANAPYALPAIGKLL